MKKGFTLAEVLITLTIIGVIAALTIPTLMKKYDQHISEVRFRYAYNYLINTLQTKIKEVGCSTIGCWLEENGFNTGLTNMDNNEREKRMKALFNAESVVNYSNDWYTWFNKGVALGLRRPGKAFNDGVGAVPFIIRNKGIGIALQNNYSKPFLKGGGNIFLFTEAGTNKKPVYAKNVFILSLNDYGNLARSSRSASWFTKKFIVEDAPESKYEAEMAVYYLLKNGGKMDYLP